MADKQLVKKNKKLISNFKDEIDNAVLLNEKYTLDDNIGVVITTTTRIKIFNIFIDIIKLLNNKDTNNVLFLLKRCTRLCNIHFNQLNKLDQININLNKIYIKNIIKLFYRQYFILI